GAARSLRWKSDAFDVQGWLLTPREPPALGTKAPMVVIVHGGPASAVRPSWSQTALLLASQGYYVLMPNPRGSFGGGEAFTRANVKDFGYGDLRDIVRGVDAAVRAAPVDPQLVVYEDEGHRLQRPDHVRDRVERIVGWFDSHLKAAPVQPPR